MADNISDKTDLTGHADLNGGQLNWISQINAGGTTYDIATHHTITFKDGSNDTTGTAWNGLTDLEIIIPSITDIVKTPVEFAGTVGADGVISWVTGHGTEAKVGNLLFVTSNCTFEGIACEAGDMAIYDGSNWNIVSGENQVEIKGNMVDNVSTIAIGSAKEVLSVEGKTLALTLDYAEIDNHISTTPGGKVGVDFDAMTVGSKYIKLVKADDKIETIGTVKTIVNATNLKDGKVTFSTNKGIATNVDFGDFSEGELPKFTKNETKELTVTGGNISKVDGIDFVDGVTFKNAEGDDVDNITVVDGITRVDGTNFVTGVHNTTASETADFTIKGYMTTVKEDVQFVEGIAGNLKPVTSISNGNFELVSGSVLATGWGEEQNDNKGEVLSSVELAADNNTSVFNEAVVNNHVLSFGSTNVTSGASLSYKSKSLAKTGFKYTAPTATTSEFTTSGFKNVEDVNYTFGKAAESTYTHSTSNWKIATTKGAYSFSNSGMIATVPAETFIESADAGTLPSWTGGSVNHIELTGSVDTTLATEIVTFCALDSNTLTIPSVYTLESSDTNSEGAIEVGKSGALANNLASVDLTSYITDVTIS